MPPRRRTALALLLALLPVSAAAQEDTRLRVAFVELPPFAMQDEDGIWLGYAVEAWRIMAERNGWTYDVQPLDLEEAEAALARGLVDAALPVPATAALEREADLALPLYTATMGVASDREEMVVAVIEGLASPGFLKLCAGLSALLLGVGALIWVFERKRNPRQFARRLLPGLGDGFWFAGVTLSTIGYGDKAPVTVAGRVVAMLWMVVGVVVTSALTASIVTIANSAGSADGALRTGAIGTVTGSATAAYLAAEGLDVRTYPTLPEAVAALGRGEVEQVAALAPALREAVSGLEPPVPVHRTDSDPVQITIALRQESPLLETVNVSVLDFNASDASRRLRAQYLED